MAKIFVGTEIWAKIETNTGTKTVTILFVKSVEGFG